MYTFSFFVVRTLLGGLAPRQPFPSLRSLRHPPNGINACAILAFSKAQKVNTCLLGRRIGEKFAKHWIFRDVLKHRFDTERKKTSKAR
jgi:hypothetical protein